MVINHLLNVIMPPSIHLIERLWSHNRPPKRITRVPVKTVRRFKEAEKAKLKLKDKNQEIAPCVRETQVVPRYS